jgi:hypothetical protein
MEVAITTTTTITTLITITALIIIIRGIIRSGTDIAIMAAVMGIMAVDMDTTVEAEVRRCRPSELTRYLPWALYRLCR